MGGVGAVTLTFAPGLRSLLLSEILRDSLTDFDWTWTWIGICNIFYLTRHWASYESLSRQWHFDKYCLTWHFVFLTWGRAINSALFWRWPGVVRLWSPWSLWRLRRLSTFHHPGDARILRLIFDETWRALAVASPLNEPCCIIKFDETMSTLRMFLLSGLWRVIIFNT